MYLVRRRLDRHDHEVVSRQPDRTPERGEFRRRSGRQDGGRSGRQDGVDDDEGLSLKEETWETLIDSVLNGECTPFIGAGLAVPYLPRGAVLAASLAEQFDYPLDDVTNLARVTQYIASQHQPSYVKRRVCERLQEAQRKTTDLLGGSLPENHLMLARLGLPVYVTTNYDDYLERAVASVTGVQPNVVLCRWSDRLSTELPPYPRSSVTSAAPTIFHLHGHIRTP